MQRKGLEPDVITYSALFYACAKGDYAEKTLLLLVEMLRNRLEPNVITYNAFINACARGENVKRALQPVRDAVEGPGAQCEHIQRSHHSQYEGRLCRVGLAVRSRKHNRDCCSCAQTATNHYYHPTRFGDNNEVFGKHVH